MKDLHSWARWFRALARKIADEGEDDLIEKARKAVKWGGAKPPPLLRGEDRWIDPFSFLYTLAYKAKAKAKPTVYRSVHIAFALQEEAALPDPTNDDLWVFPMPVAMNALFHPKKTTHFDLLWRLFRQATGDEDSIVAADYEEILAIKGVAPTKLSHGLFLSNPYRFLPVDGFALLADAPAHVPALANNHPYTDYAAACDRVRQFFPKCEPFEINYFLYWQGDDGSWVNAKSSVFHVDTNLHDDGNDVDFWPEFEENNSVRTSVPVGAEPFPVEKPKDGDLVLVRYGETQGRAIGVVMRNDFAKGNNPGEQGRIHVSWINRASSPLVAPTESSAFGATGCDSATYRAFAGTAAYRPTRDLLKGVLPVSQQTHPLNQILYGPPGTGKTWNTVARALAIVEGRDVESVEKERKEQRAKVKRRFDLAREAGQVAMVTFHQNYAYEDFFEGIRPTVEDASSDGIGYLLRAGVLREMAERAAQNLRTSRTVGKDAWTPQEVVQGFLEWIRTETASGGTKRLAKGAGGGDIVVSGVYEGRDGDIAGVQLGGTTNQKLFRRVLDRDYQAFHGNGITSYTEIARTRPGSSAWHGQAVYFFELLKMVRQYHEDVWHRPERKTTERRNFVLILDEINRGNIARIFGELITLVEESRRLGREDETKVTLPYSGDEFGVPENLYLIGTMNTADRSIALLDTALRRRFEFVEMMPDSSRVDWEVDGVHLGRLLDAMNERIRFLRDREHQIGHTYFLEVRGLDGLRAVFQKQILPLLQEYFYDDWAKIAAVLGNNGFVESMKCPAALEGTELVEPGVKSYELLRFDDPRWGKSGPYQRIYSEKAVDGQGTDEAEKKGDGTDGE